MKTLTLTAGARADGPGERALGEILAAPGEDEAGFRAWLSGLQEVGVLDGETLPGLLASQPLPLWDWTGPLLRHSPIARRVHLIEALWSELWAARPDEVETSGLGLEGEVLTQRLCTALGILYQGSRHGYQRKRSWWPRLSVSRRRSARSRWAGHGAAGGVLWMVVGKEDATSWAADVVRTAWPEVESRNLAGRVAVLGPACPNLDRLPGSGDAVLSVALEPHRIEAPEPARGEVGPDVQTTVAGVEALWKRLGDLPSLEGVLNHRGVRFADLARSDLGDVFQIALADAIRVWGRAVKVTRDVAPQALCVLAGGDGYDRAAIHACRASGRPMLVAERRVGCVEGVDGLRRVVRGPAEAAPLGAALADLAASPVRGSV